MRWTGLCYDTDTKNCEGAQKCFLCEKKVLAVNCGLVADSGAFALEEEKIVERCFPPKKKAQVSRGCR